LLTDSEDRFFKIGSFFNVVTIYLSSSSIFYNIVSFAVYFNTLLSFMAARSVLKVEGKNRAKLLFVCIGELEAERPQDL
jgi:hypothetical protein